MPRPRYNVGFRFHGGSLATCCRRHPAIRMKRLGCFVVLLLGVFAPAVAQTLEVSVLRGWARMSKAPLGSSSPESANDSDTTFRNGYTNGLRLTLNPHRYYGYELGYFQTRVTLQTRIQATSDVPKQTYDSKVTLHQAFFDFLVYWMPKKRKVAPLFRRGRAGAAEQQSSRHPWMDGSLHSELRRQLRRGHQDQALQPRLGASRPPAVSHRQAVWPELPGQYVWRRAGEARGGVLRDRLRILRPLARGVRSVPFFSPLIRPSTLSVPPRLPRPCEAHLLPLQVLGRQYATGPRLFPAAI